MSTDRTSSGAKAGTVTTVVIGAGHAGLAMSRRLTERAIDHVVLERAEVANSWRRERWDSLRLLTPNWMSRLPGFRYRGTDPDGFMTMTEVIAFIESYAAWIGAPVQNGTTVTSVCPDPYGYRVTTDRGTWRCRSVVLASGAFNTPTVPAVASAVPDSVRTITPREYRNPTDLEHGGVLVVGASATGLQLAEEIQRSGRPVTLSVGEHVRMPRLYRGLDVQRWMMATGLLDERYDQVDDIVRARHVPSPQLVGTPARTTLDLNTLTASGVRLVGRLAGVRSGKALFSGALRNHCAMADLKLGRMLDGFDAWARAHDFDAAVDLPERFEPTRVGASPTLELDLERGEIRSIVWATGFKPDYSWLHVPVLDRRGKLRHDGGVVDAPGMYVLGLGFMRRRKSSFMHGAEDDSNELACHLHAYLDSATRHTMLVAAG